VSPESYDGVSGPTVGIAPLDLVNFDFLSGYFLTGDSTAATLVNSYSMLTGTPTDGTVFRFANNVTVGVNEIGAISVSVYPNPATGVVNISFEAEENTTVAVTDLTGHVLIEEQVNTGAVKLKMDISALAGGMYLVTINGNPTGDKLIVR
jgi:hypothetical protein